MNEDIIKIIKNGGIGVIPTDTIYGLVGSAFSPVAIQRIYEIKGRDTDKGLIVLISNIEDLKPFDVEVSEKTKIFLKKYWPGKVSVILDSKSKYFEYLKQKDGTIAFRVPDNEELVQLLRETGPLIAPSANPQGNSPATIIAQAKNYFGKKVDFYIDGGILESTPSTLVRIKDDNISILRQGEVKIDKE
ncbi:MAG: L-threonylcarbamoyladenylate synthase [Candidatus Paceibacterota bacterium]